MFRPTRPSFGNSSLATEVTFLEKIRSRKFLLKFKKIFMNVYVTMQILCMCHWLRARQPSPDKVKKLSLLHSVHTSYSMATGGIFPGGIAASVSIHPLSHTSTWYSALLRKRRDFTFTFTFTHELNQDCMKYIKKYKGV